MRPKSNPGDGFLCAKFKSGQHAYKRHVSRDYVVQKCGTGCQDPSGGTKHRKSLFSLSQGSPQRSRLGQDILSVRE